MTSKNHILSKIKGNALPKHLIFFDCESRKEKQDFGRKEIHTLRLGIATYVQLNTELKITRKETIIFKDTKTFFDFVVKKSMYAKRQQLYVIAHNQHFDFNISDTFRELANRGWKLGSHVWDKNAFFCFWTKLTYKICFVDSTNFYRGVSIKELGRMLNFSKGEVDFERVNDDDLEIYCRRDVDILEKSMLTYFEFLKVHDLGKFSVTVALQSLTAFRHRFMKEKIYIHDNPEVIELERESYKGGMVQSFQIGDCGECYKLDINSAYPFHMKHLPVPTKLIRFLHKPKWSEFWELFENYLIIARVFIKVNKPFIGVKRKHKLQFPELNGYWVTLTTPEIREVYRCGGEILKVDKVAGYEYSETVFSEYIDFFYGLKKSYTGINQIFRELAKIFMNGLSGKFGQKKSESVELYDSEDFEFYFKLEQIRETGKHIKTFQIGTQVFTYTKSDINSYNSFVAIISFITAYERIFLWRMIELCGENNVYGCDTDSVFTNNEGYNNIKFLIGDNLGDLKNEGHGRLINYNLKDYEFGEQVKQKGIKKGSYHLGGKVWVVTQWYTTKMLLEHNLFGCVVIEKNVKIINRIYEKGEVLANKRVKPFVFSELEDNSSRNLAKLECVIQ